MTQMTLMTGAERRRRWSNDERRQILEAALAPGAIIAEVGRRWDVSTSLIYKWRREELVAAQGSGFARVMLEDKAGSPAPQADGTITVELGGAHVRICSGASTTLAAAVLKALKARSRRPPASGSGSPPAPRTCATMRSEALCGVFDQDLSIFQLLQHDERVLSLERSA